MSKIFCDIKSTWQELPETFGFVQKQLFVTENHRFQAPRKNACMLPGALKPLDNLHCQAKNLKTIVEDLEISSSKP